MSYFNNTKWWAIAVILLIILNAVTLTIFWVERKDNSRLPPKQDDRGGAALYLTKELALDSMQQMQYNQLVLEHRQRTRQLRGEIRHTKDAFFELLGDTAVTDDVIKNAAASVSAIEQQIDILTFNHFKKIRTVCTAEQKKKFDSIIKNAVQMMGPSQPPERKLPNDSLHQRNPPHDGAFRPDLPPPPLKGNESEPPPAGRRPPPPPDK